MPPLLACPFSVQEFLQLGLENAKYFKWQKYQPHCNIDRFKKQYGVTPQTAADVWQLLREQPVGHGSRLEPNSKPIHLLMSFHFLFKYPEEEELGLFFLILSPKTVGKWTKHYVIKIAGLLDNLMGKMADNHKGLVWIMSVDGVHCPTWELRPFSKNNASHKFGMKPGFNYELGMSIYEPKLIWCNGPTQPGLETDLGVFVKRLKFALPAGCRVIADQIYAPERDYVSTKKDLDSKEVRLFKNRVCARQENFNQRIKCFKILSTKYRHARAINGPPELPHKFAMRACCAITQIAINNGSTRLLDPYPCVV